jgi:hypothetical protein
MSLEIDHRTAPPVADVLTGLMDLSEDIDLREAYLDFLSAGSAHDELLQSLGKLTDEAFVELLYGEFLQRAPAAADLALWVGELQNGAARESLLEIFATSDEALALATPDEVELLGQHFPETMAAL